MAEIFAWDAVAANNNNAPPNGAPENMEYDEVNNTMREMYAVLARFVQGSLGGTKTTAGTQPAYTLVSGFTLGAYAAGQVFAFVAHASSTGNVTLNVDGLGAGAVNDSRGNQLGSGDIVADGIYLVVRTASAFRVLGSLSATSARAIVANTLDQSYLATGTANAIVLTTGKFTAYANGQLVAFRAADNNSGACTINIDGLGAEALEDFGSQALATGDIITDRIYLCGRTGGEWRVLTSLPIDLASQVSGILPVANGGTGGANAADARTNLGAAAATVGQGKHTIWIPAAAMYGGSPSDVTVDVGGAVVRTRAFDPTSAEFTFFSIAMPKSWDEGTLSAQFYWTHPAAVTNFGVRWTCGLAAFANDVAIANSYVAGGVTDTGGTTSDVYISDETSAINPGNTQAENDLILGFVSRDATNGGDTLAVDAYLIGVKLFYTTNAATDD